MGLDYLHSECHVVHTDLKLDNILMEFEDRSVIEDFVQNQVKNPMARKTRDGRLIYQSHNDFGPLRSFYILPKIADFGLAQQGDGPQPQIHPIQPDHYRAPEVIFGTGWTYSADIWNFGLLVYASTSSSSTATFLTHREIDLESSGEQRSIQNGPSSSGKYNSQAHLAEMIALLGHPPKELLERE
ncbi:MAG: hypothetical protein M1834_005944 [Cirrosporium novae-zelandiae]|nr:MAG: hypothetical protein M1834_005944 [Cirrosporium novae-zelandiae]